MVEVITGVNLPMVLAIAQNREGCTLSSWQKRRRRRPEWVSPLLETSLNELQFSRRCAITALKRMWPDFRAYEDQIIEIRKGIFPVPWSERSFEEEINRDISNLWAAHI
jgi:hypothetical protein